MSALSLSDAGADPYECRMTLRQMQEEAIQPLLLATGLVGLTLFALTSPPQFPPMWQRVVLAITLMLVSSLSAYLLGRHYRAAAWVLLLGWCASAAGLALHGPAMPAAGLLSLPVAFAVLFISVPAGFLTAVLANGLSLAAFIATRQAVQPELVAMICTTHWGVLLLGWSSTHPIRAAVRWSWQSYGEARCQLEVARDRQAELNQAVKDLADASVQMGRLNQLLDAARRTAEEAQRVKAEFVANVSHELRTPLNMIIGFAEMIVNAPVTYGVRLPPALLADVAAIYRNSQHLASLIGDVLDISQIEARRLSLNREWLSLAEVIRAAQEAVSPLFQARGLSVSTDIPQDLPLVYCDRTRVRQVLLNLLGNAARFVEHGGVTVQAAADERQVVVTVTDTGPGIAEADLPKLFEPFRQLDGSLTRRQGGSGLGLNISRRFIELHGGQMGVRSQVGVGSAFWLSLPLQAPNGGGPDALRWLASGWEPHRRSSLTPKPQIIPRMVLLEEGDVLLDAARRYLDGVEVEAATTPAQARDLLNAAPAQLLLVRGQTPSDAEAWADLLRDTRFATPVVACSFPSAASSGRAGVAGYLTKPVTRDELLAAIASLDVPVRSILLVDDNPEALQLFRRMLSSAQQHYRVFQASSGQVALDLLRARSPDLLLLDLIMPGMDGFAVLREKGCDPVLAKIPVLVISARDQQGETVVAPSLLATRSGGLSTLDILRAALAVSDALSVPHRALGSASPAAPDG